MKFSKPTKIVSKKIRKSAKDEHCTIRSSIQCAYEDTVVFAHLNSNNKGMGNKSPDLFGVYSCSHCHSELDSGNVSSKDQLRALQETQLKLYEKGLIKVDGA